MWRVLAGSDVSSHGQLGGPQIESAKRETTLKRRFASFCLGVALSSVIFGAVTTLVVDLSPGPGSDDFGPVELDIFYFVFGFFLWLPVSTILGLIVLLIVRIFKKPQARLLMVFCTTLVISLGILVIGLGATGLAAPFITVFLATVSPLSATVWTFLIYGNF
ncbi:hypothetical protein [Haematomicrobium sanguinis]|uniref:hypothetical protein n=1 Tax=Haematomicrobium sanguinis TaxID=479106 RepID=UPI00047A0776|nr:hypothetical protein [Haematomicrobium sanguinis]